MIVVYSGKSCGPCIATKVGLEARGLAFEERPAHEHIDALEALRLRHDLSMALPYVVAGDQVWNGFQPSRIGDLAAMMETA